MIFCAPTWYEVTMMKFIAAALTAALALTACTGVQGPSAEGYVALPADQVTIGLVQVIETNGVRSAVLRADTAYMFNDSAKAHLRGVYLVLYDEEGTESTTLRSLTGELDTNTEAMVARGSVVLIAEAGARRIETEEFHFDPARDRIWSPVSFVMNRNGSITRGRSFESDAKFVNFRVREPVGTVEGLRFTF
jgi:LPS export ABC transporter protein LptC